MAIKDWNGFKKNGDSYIPNDDTSRTRIGALSNLLTTAKDNLVAAINELVTSISTINGKIPSGASSSNKMATASDVAAKISWADAGKSVARNKLKITAKTTTTNNITFTVNDDKSITVNTGTGGSSAQTLFEIGKIYEANNMFLSGCPSGGSSETFDLRISDKIDTGNGVAVTVPYDATGYRVYIVVRNGQTISNKVFKPMLTDADVPIEPYVEYIPDNTELMTWEANAKTGAINLAHNEAVNGSGSNVTWTVNEDTKEITISSNNSSAPVFISLGDYIYHALPEGTYKLSDNVGSDDLYTYVARKKGASGTADTSLMTNNSNHEVTFTVDYSQYDYFKIAIVVNSAKTFSNKVAKVMIAPKDYNGDYVAPAMTNNELTKAVEPISGTPTTDFTYDSSRSQLYKIGKLVICNIRINDVSSATQWSTALATIPQGFRPKGNNSIFVPVYVGGNFALASVSGYSGDIQSSIDIPTNANVVVSASWITD